MKLNYLSPLKPGSKNVKHFLLFVLFLVGSSISYSQITYTFNYTGNVQTFTLQPGSYSVECWGGKGETAVGQPAGGVGGYSAGTLSVSTTTTIYIAVGGKGSLSPSTNAFAPGGWNGGGQGYASTVIGAGGGGASHIATATGQLSALSTNTSAIIIVAGGGGGSGWNGVGGNGGGLVGGNGNSGTGGTVGGTFGSGASGTTGSTVGGGGGGWFGGNLGNPGNTGGSGGGSGYIGGVTGGVTAQSGQTGYVPNPTANGDGLILITQLCNINIYASGTNSTNPILCSGQSLTLTTDAVSNYLWSDGSTTNSIVVAPTTNTMYSLSGTSSMACTANAAINVIVSSGVPVLSVTNPSNNICLGQSATLTATGANSYTWTGGVTNGQPFVPSTTTSYTVTGENGCGTTTAVTDVTVSPLQVNVTANPTLVCEGYAATLTAVSAVSNYTWLPNSMTGSLTTVAPTAPSIYTVVASDGICSGTATVALATKTTPTVTAVGSETTVCEGDPLNLSASGAQTYVWTPDNISGANIAVTPTASTLYQVAGTNSLGCTAYANWLVVVKPLPTGNATTNKPLVCPGGEAVLSANGGTAYVWAGGPSTQTYSVNPNVAMVYTVDVTGSNGCTATRTVGVNVYSPTVAITAGTTSLCDGESTILNSSPATSYTWNGTSGLSFLSISPTVSTVYDLEATTFSSGVSCVASASILITVNPLPVVSIVATKTVLCRNEAPAVLSGSGAMTYTWSNSATTPTINSSNIVTTTYFVDGIDANGCAGSSAGLLVKVDPCSGLRENAGTLEQAFMIYPNPNNGNFTVKSGTEQSLIMVNELGQIIHKFNLTEESDYKQEIKDLKPGIYFIMDQNNHGATQKIVIW